MTARALPLANALAVHFDPEPFATFAFAELDACPMAAAGVCQNPACSRGFAPARGWQRYCSDACRRADETEFRRVGHRAAPALLAHRLGKYERHDPAVRALSASARRFIGQLQTDWLRDRQRRAAMAGGLMP